jgi:hypothetical protein
LAQVESNQIQCLWQPVRGWHKRAGKGGSGVQPLCFQGQEPGRLCHFAGKKMEAEYLSSGLVFSFLIFWRNDRNLVQFGAIPRRELQSGCGRIAPFCGELR